MSRASLPSEPEKYLRELARRAEAERDALRQTFSAIGTKLRPKRIRSRAQSHLMDGALDAIGHAKTAVAAHPARVIGVAALLGFILARGPLIRLTVKGIRSGRDCVSKWVREHRKPRDEEDENE